MITNYKARMRRYRRATVSASAFASSEEKEYVTGVKEKNIFQLLFWVGLIYLALVVTSFTLFNLIPALLIFVIFNLLLVWMAYMRVTTARKNRGKA